MGAVWQDLHYALRGIVRAPFLSFAVFLALVAGAGLNAALFTPLDSAWLRTSRKRTCQLHTGDSKLFGLDRLKCFQADSFAQGVTGKK